MQKMKIGHWGAQLSFIIIFILFLISCQRSQFATTTRTSKNGKVTYTKNYHRESRFSSITRSRNNHIKNNKQQPALSSLNEKVITPPEIDTITPIPEIQTDIFIASTSKDPIYTRLIKQHEHLNKIKHLAENGRVDTIVKDNRMPAGQKEVPHADKRKVEKFGLSGFILSIFGLIPLYGLPLAILGLVFGIISLRKIHRKPTLYKGKGFAITSIILGALGIAVNLLLLGILIALVFTLGQIAA